MGIDDNCSASRSGGGVALSIAVVHLVQEPLLRVLRDLHGAADFDVSTRLDIKHRQADPRVARHVSRLQPALFLRSCDDEGVHWHGDCIISAELLQLLLRLFYHPLIALLIQEGF